MPPKKEQKSKEAKALAAQGAAKSKGRKKKWSKSKGHDRKNNLVCYDAAGFEKMLKEIPKSKVWLFAISPLSPRSEVIVPLVVIYFFSLVPITCSLLSRPYSLLRRLSSFFLIGRIKCCLLLPVGWMGVQVITVASISEKLKVNGALARKSIDELVRRGLIKVVIRHCAQRIYTKVGSFFQFLLPLPLGRCMSFLWKNT